MNQRKGRLLPLCLAIALLLGGCGTPASDPTPTSTQAGVGEVDPPVPTAPLPFAQQSMRLALCTSPAFIDDKGLNAACYDGVLNFLSFRGGMDSVSPLQETSGDPAIAVEAFRELAPSYDVMIFVGPAFSRLAPLAQSFPEKYFILVDAPLTDGQGEPVQLDNVCALEFAEQECGFLAGIAAAMESETGLVATLLDHVSPSGTRYYYGFRSGVAYANGNLNTSAEVVEYPGYGAADGIGRALGWNYTGDSDVTAYTLSNALMDQGCDVLFVAAGTSGVGAVNAVKGRSGVKLIGADTDQFLNGVNGPESVVLTSVVKQYSPVLLRKLQDIPEGLFQGGSYTLRTADNAVGFVSASDRQQLSPDTLEALRDAYPLLQDGTLVPLSGPVD